MSLSKEFFCVSQIALYLLSGHAQGRAIREKETEK